MYIKSPNAKTLQYKNRIALCNIKNGSFVKVPLIYYDYLEMLLNKNEGNIPEFDDNKVIDCNLKELFDSLTKIKYYITQNELKEETEEILGIIYINITNRCNLKCKHCAQTSEFEAEEYLSTEQWKNIFSQLVTIKPRQINITGGEPLIRNDFEDLIYYFRKQYHGNLVLSTNGTLVNVSNAKIIAHNVDQVSISMDGYDEASCEKIRGKGIYNKVIEAVHLLQKEGMKNITVSMLESSYTQGHIKDFYRLCEFLEVDPLIHKFSPSGRGRQYREELIVRENMKCDENREIHLKCSLCRPGQRELAIRSDGSVFPCAPLEERDKFCMGSVLKENLFDIINKSRINQILEPYRPWNQDECKDCNVNLFCHNCLYHIQNIKEDERLFRIDCQRERKQLQSLVWG